MNKLKRVCCGISFVFILWSIGSILLGSLSSGFDPEGYKRVALLYLIIAALSFVGIMIMVNSIKNNDNKFKYGLITGLILPLIIFFGYIGYGNYINTKFCNEDPRWAFCEDVLSKSERNQWYENNCEKINRANYYLYRCPSEGSINGQITVPEEFVNIWITDRGNATDVLRSFDFPSHIIKTCLQVNSPIRTPIPNGRICESVYGEWPNFPSEWKLVSSIYSIENKSYKFEFKKDDMSIVCDHTAQYCKSNW